jgi:tRNA(Arg) A34 adenosine deaminase TadA
MSLNLSATLAIKKLDIVSIAELDLLVHEIQKVALELGMIPISSIISREQPDGSHQILGGGFNLLRDGIPGIHGETGAIINMGRVAGGYKDLTATSSLSPCPFCQGCLAAHMGIKKVRILDNVNYVPDKSGYAAAGIKPEIVPSTKVEQLFQQWVRDPVNRILWNRDIGIPEGNRVAPYSPAHISVWDKYVARANRLATEAMQHAEAPIGAVIVDELGEVAGAGFARIKTDNDPSKTAAVTAWRNCGSRNDWGSHTLVLSAGPDQIAYSMFKIFGFGQLVVGSNLNFAGQTQAVSELRHTRNNLSIPVHILGDRSSDGLLEKWRKSTDRVEIEEYLGVDFR